MPTNEVLRASTISSSRCGATDVPGIVVASKVVAYERRVEGVRGSSFPERVRGTGALLLLLLSLGYGCGTKETAKDLVSASVIASQLPPPEHWHQVRDEERGVYKIEADDGSATIAVATETMLFDSVPPPSDGRLRGFLKTHPESVLRRQFQKHPDANSEELSQLQSVHPGRLGGLDALVLRMQYRNRKSSAVRSRTDFVVPGMGGWVVVRLSYASSDEEQQLPQLFGILNKLQIGS